MRVCNIALCVGRLCGGSYCRGGSLGNGRVGSWGGRSDQQGCIGFVKVICAWLYFYSRDMRNQCVRRLLYLC